MGHMHTEQILVVFPKFTFTRASCILIDKSGSLTPEVIWRCLETFGGVTTGIWWVEPS